jgi:Zn ribbon nucleic-acid-binding protein
MSSEPDEAADWIVAELCPGCCTIDDIPEFTPSAEVLTPLVECARCGFRFPILPDGFKQFTLDSLHNHDCSGGEAGDWQAVGQAIVDSIRESAITGADLAERFEALWPDNAPGSGTRGAK